MTAHNANHDVFAAAEKARATLDEIALCNEVGMTDFRIELRRTIAEADKITGVFWDREAAEDEKTAAWAAAKAEGQPVGSQWREQYSIAARNCAKSAVEARRKATVARAALFSRAA